MVIKPGKKEVEVVNIDLKTKESPDLNDDPKQDQNTSRSLSLTTGIEVATYPEWGVDRSDVYLLAQVIEGEAADRAVRG